MLHSITQSHYIALLRDIIYYVDSNTFVTYLIHIALVSARPSKAQTEPKPNLV